MFEYIYVNSVALSYFSAAIISLFYKILGRFLQRAKQCCLIVQYFCKCDKDDNREISVTTELLACAYKLP
jgi:hypothetical protein